MMTVFRIDLLMYISVSVVRSEDVSLVCRYCCPIGFRDIICFLQLAFLFPSMLSCVVVGIIHSFHYSIRDSLLLLL